MKPFFLRLPLIHVEFVQSRSRDPRSHSCSPLPPVLCVHCGREAARPILTSLACLTCALLCSACPDACCSTCKNKVRQTPRQNMKRQVPLAKWFGPVMTKIGIWESLKFTCVCIYFTTYLFTPAFLCHITHFTFFPHKNAPCLLQEASLLVNLDIFCSVIADLQTMPPYNPTHLIFKLVGFVKFVRYSSIQIFQMFSLSNG